MIDIFDAKIDGDEDHKFERARLRFGHAETIVPFLVMMVRRVFLGLCAYWRHRVLTVDVLFQFRIFSMTLYATTRTHRWISSKNAPGALP
jgi:hypothetical protein